MNRNLLLTLTLCLVAIGAMASPRNLKQARLIAGNAAKLQGTAISTDQGAVGRTRANGQTADNLPYYIFNKVDNRGFIIVSGDDRMPDVLGYTDSGAFDATHMPDGFKFMLEAYAKTVEGLQAGNDYVINAVAQLKNRTRAVTTTVGPLLKSQWSQYLPFNYYCPKMENGENASAGCEPIALTQIMRYHQWPKQTKAEIPAYTTATQKYNIAAVPAGTVYEWSKMQDKYTSQGSPTTMRACGTLLANVGQAMKADYNDDGYGATGANIINMVGPLVDYFDYDPDLLSYQTRSNHTLAAWENLIANEIIARRPVFYEAYGRTPDGGQDGHAVVIDGINTQGLFHVNWGWAGDQDGWFDIDAMIGDEITWNIDPNVLVGIMPNNNKSDDKPVVSLLTMTRRKNNDPSVTVSGERDDESEPFSGTFHFVLENRTAKAFAGYVAAGVSNGDGTFTVISTDKKQVEVAAMQDKTFSYVSVDLPFSHVFAEGSTLVHGLVSYDGTNWLPALKNDEYGIEVAATDTKLTGMWKAQSAVFKTQSGSYALEENKPTRFVLTITNNGKVKTIKDHYLWLYWADTANEDNYGYIGSGSFYTGDILPGKSKDYVFTYTPKATGSYYLYAYDPITTEYYDTNVFTVSAATAITGVETNGMGIFGGDGSVIVKGMAGQTVRIYSADGRLVKQALVKGNAETIAIRQGLYIVNGTKVLVR